MSKTNADSSKPDGFCQKSRAHPLSRSLLILADDLSDGWDAIHKLCCAPSIKHFDDVQKAVAFCARNDDAGENWVQTINTITAPLRDNTWPRFELKHPAMRGTAALLMQMSPCGYAAMAYAYDLDHMSYDELHLLHNALFAHVHFVAAVGTTGDKHGFAFDQVVDLRTSQVHGECRNRRMTREELANQFAYFADEVTAEHHALCNQVTVTGLSAALRFLRRIDPAAKWTVKRDHATWRRRLRNLPCSGTGKAQKTWTQETLVQWYYTEGREVIRRT